MLKTMRHSWRARPFGVVDPFLLSRLHFAFTIVYHCLFPPLAMGLALLMVMLPRFNLAMDL